MDPKDEFILSFDKKMYDKDGKEIEPGDLQDMGNKVFDLMNNRIILMAEEQKDTFYCENGKKLRPPEIKLKSEVYTESGDPVVWNNLNLIHKFYNSSGELVPYKTLGNENILFSKEGAKIPLDPLNRHKTQFLDGDKRKIIEHDSMEKIEEVFSLSGEKMSGLDLVRTQRLYNKVGELLGPKDLCVNQKIYDINGSEIGEIDNQFKVLFPPITNLLGEPKDLRDVLKENGFADPKQNTKSRDDMVCAVKVFDTYGNLLHPDKIDDMIDKRQQEKLFDVNDNPVNLDEVLKVQRTKNSRLEIVGLDELRESGHIFDEMGRPVNGVTLDRIKTVLDGYRKAMGDEELDRISKFDEKSVSRYNKMSVTNSKRRDDRGDGRTRGFADTLNLDLLADESFDLEVNVEEVEDTQPLAHDFRLHPEEPGATPLRIQHNNLNSPVNEQSDVGSNRFNRAGQLKLQQTEYPSKLP